MNPGTQPRSGSPLPWVALVLGIAALVVAGMALTASLLLAAGAGSGPAFGGLPSMMGRGGAIGGAGMMGWSGAGPEGGWGGAAQPGDPGFVAGTAASPRVIRILAGPGYAFSPSTITVARGETVTFLVTDMGPVSHEFMVGPADAVAADAAGTPEIDGLTMMQTGSLTYTFDGSGPYAYACHAPGHFEAGMRGTIAVVE